MNTDRLSGPTQIGVKIGSDVKSVHENESIYIPVRAVHRLANQGKIPLELIEVQTGSYLGEEKRCNFEDPLQAEQASSAAMPARR